jgi:segregation and condensation protein A
MREYRVKLDIYNGPMDLLLYLIRRDEIDIQDIPIARVTQQYIEHVSTLQHINPDLAGEFLVLAATLLEIKTRMLLPKQEHEGAAVEAFDPRSDLVRQLLEYKAFKDAASDLRDAAESASQRFGRRPPELQAPSGVTDLEDVQIWNLVEAFNSLLKSIGQNLGQTEIIYDDTPIEMHAQDILDRLRDEGRMTFRQVFAGRTLRTELVGLFLAMLELIRRRQIRVTQEELFGEIHICLLKPQEAQQAAASGQEPVAGSQEPVAGSRNSENIDPDPASSIQDAGNRESATRDPESAPGNQESPSDSEVG